MYFLGKYSVKNTVPELDSFDRQLLTILETNGRMSNVELAQRINLSPTPCGRRLKRLEDEGVITGYQAKINPAAIDLGVCVIVSVRIAAHTPDALRQFLRAIKGMPEITECLLVTGSIDYLLRVWVKDLDALRLFVANELQTIPSVKETTCMVVLHTEKSTGLLT